MYPHTVCYKLHLKAKRLAERHYAEVCYSWQLGKDQFFASEVCFLQPSPLWTKVHFPKWLSKLFWTGTEIQRTSAGCCTSSSLPSHTGYPAKGENTGCTRTLKQHSLTPSLADSQPTCLSRKGGEGSECFINLTPVTRHNECVKQPRVHSLSPTVRILECLQSGQHWSYTSDL